jgi:hypothetical protein
MHSPTLSFTSALDGDGRSTPHNPRERPGTKCIGGWAGIRTVLDGCGNSLPHRDSIPDRHFTDYATPANKDRRYKREISLYSTEGREMLKWVLNWQV